MIAQDINGTKSTAADSDEMMLDEAGTLETAPVGANSVSKFLYVLAH